MREREREREVLSSGFLGTGRECEREKERDKRERGREGERKSESERERERASERAREQEREREQATEREREGEREVGTRLRAWFTGAFNLVQFPLNPSSFTKLYEVGKWLRKQVTSPSQIHMPSTRDHPPPGTRMLL